MEEAVVRLSEILAKCEHHGITQSSLGEILKKHKTSSKWPLTKKKKASCGKQWNPPFWGGVLAATLALLYMLNLHTFAGLMRAWILWDGGDVYNEWCAVQMPDVAMRMFRAPEDCSMCRDVSQVDRVKGITPQEFEKKYAYSARPVVITDAMVNWTAPQTFSFEFFREIYINDFDRYRCQFFPYQTEFRSLSEVFRMSPERAALKDDAKPWYVGWSNCNETIARILREHYGRPYFLPQSAENKHIDWIFMGSPGYGAHMHVDSVAFPSWQAQLSGQKKWFLEPPPECIYECQSMDVTVNTGEIIVLDTNRWYHKTLIVSDGISITIGAEYD